MKNKCKNCGFEYGENDIFCAHCGQKIEKEENNQIDERELEQMKNEENSPDLDLSNRAKPQDILKDKNISIEELKAAFLQTNPSLTKDFTLNSKGSNGSVFNFIAFLLIVAFVLSMVMLIVLNRHSEKKMIIEYKNMMANPSTIPELHEPSNLKDLKDNFSNVERFLTSYLRYSKDSSEKKQQVFIAFLKEAEKLPHITNESLAFDDLNVCRVIKDAKVAKKCSKTFTSELSNVGILTRYDYNTVYFYPDWEYLDKLYSPFFSRSIGYYLLFKSKYPEPTMVGMSFNIKPKELADKIADNEIMINNIEDKELQEMLSKELYEDFRRFIFSPVIYATTTQEMKKEFKDAYNYFLRTKKKSALRPVIMSYLDKQRSYDEENFEKDYPYEKFDKNEPETLDDSAFCDIFTQVRKSMISKMSAIDFSFIYNLQTAQWYKFDKQYQPKASDYIISSIDEDNNMNVYNNVYSFIQEISTPKRAQLFYLNNALYVFEQDNLKISKFVFDGKLFKLQQLSHSDITSVFPGIEIINIDNFPSYNILVEKENKKASYIILSKYSKNYDDYTLTALNDGEFNQLSLPNMFSVDSLSDVEIAFHNKHVEPDTISDTTPVYKFIIHTKGQEYSSLNNDKITNYDKETADSEQETQEHKANIMPKIENTQVEKSDEELLNNQAPTQALEVPKDDD